EKIDVCLAFDGKMAIKVFNEEHPDIILMDVLMPLMNGYDATRIIKESAGDNLIPVIFLTALTDDDSLAKCVQAGGDDFMTKPYNPIILKSKIDAMERIRRLYATQKKQTDELRYYHQRMQREHAIAEKVYSGILYSGFLKVDNIKYILSPMAIFNGDLLLNVFKPYGKQIIMLGDFTGHGLSAAIGALPVSDIFNTMALKGFAINEIAAEINTKLKAILPTGMYLAACIVELDLQQERILYWNGGIPEALLVGKNGRIKTTLNSNHLPLGIVENDKIDFSPDILKIEENDRIYIYSDGIIEAANHEGKLFGTERLFDYFKEGADIENLFEDILKGVNQFRFGIGQSDDITMVEFTCSHGAASPDSEHHKNKVIMPENATLNWKITMELNPDMLRTMNLPTFLTGLLWATEVQGLQQHKTNIFIVLSELYTNALEHGILKLSSTLKKSPEGFLNYTLERKKALTTLNQGYIKANMELTQTKTGGKLTIYIEDSGDGFDFKKQAQLTVNENAMFGRGILILRSLCSELVFYGTGNKVEAVYVWQ
ncbi:MAG: SpoIIE family protein phosphatase, partial [Nitrospirae bacterium]|nr:SpoIIE family protein phosphatase [Nitrospirota bacterium]